MYKSSFNSHDYFLCTFPDNPIPADQSKSRIRHKFVQKPEGRKKCLRWASQFTFYLFFSETCTFRDVDHLNPLEKNGHDARLKDALQYSGRIDKLSWHSVTLLIKHGCVRVWWVLFTEIWIHCYQNWILRMCGLLKYLVSRLIIIYDHTLHQLEKHLVIFCLPFWIFSQHLYQFLCWIIFNASRKLFMVSWISQLRSSELGIFFSF